MFFSSLFAFGKMYWHCCCSSSGVSVRGRMRVGGSECGTVCRKPSCEHVIQYHARPEPALATSRIHSESYHSLVAHVVPYAESTKCAQLEVRSIVEAFGDSASSAAHTALLSPYWTL
eukprot:scaffold13836_cov74-Phaeocystis_antarctica.AAC.1